MSQTPPKITCLFFSDLSVAGFLAGANGRALVGDLLVECSRQPALSYLLNVETPANYPGIAGVLGGVDVGTLAHANDRLPAPIIFASGMSVSIAALRAALALLAKPDDRLAHITLLVPLGEARALGAALAVADQFAIAWDAVALPHEEIDAFAKWLGEEKILTKDNFAGLFPYAAEPLALPHAQRLATLLFPISARVPAIRSEIS
jgi:hypothetical protein